MPIAWAKYTRHRRTLGSEVGIRWYLSSFFIFIFFAVQKLGVGVRKKRSEPCRKENINGPKKNKSTN